ASTTADFAIGVQPSSRTAVPGASAQFQITITPLAGFTGDVNLGISSLPTGVTGVFTPAVVSIVDASSKSATLDLTTSSGAPLGNHAINISGHAGSTIHTQQVALNVVSPTST